MGGGNLRYQKKRRRSIEAAEFAVFVLSDQEMLAIDPLNTRDIETLITIVRGEVVYQDPNYTPYGFGRFG